MRGVAASTILYRVLRKGTRNTSTAQKRQVTADEPFASGRDPSSLGEALLSAEQNLGWTRELQFAGLTQRWADIVGPEVGAHSWPEVSGDRLLVRCSSTAWASTLRLMRQRILDVLREEYPDMGVTDIRFRGPDAPSWKKGPRAVPGRGPRDTYG